jgi:trimethylamine-N-oxide reductase cytochrome c-type subunit TorC
MEIGRKKFLIILIVVVLLVGSAGSYFYISTPTGCTTCHEMKPFYETWISSDHMEVDCHECHTADIGFYMNDMIKHLQGTDASEIEGNPPTSTSNQQCLVCHVDPLPEKKEGGSKIECFTCHEVSHYKHVLEIPGDYDCSTCHEDHTMIVLEETCRSCHDESV